jgi:hypothetical protein
VRLDRVDEPVDREPLEHDYASGVVNAGHQLAHPDTAELPVRELRRGTRRGLLAAGDTEHGALQHGRLDVLSLRRPGRAASQNLQGHTGFDVRVLTGLVPMLENRGDKRLGQRDRYAGTARALGGGDDVVGPVLAVGDDGREVQLLDVAGDRVRRLERVDHRDGAADGEEADDRGGMLQPVADHEADGRAVWHAGVAEPGRDRVGVFGDVGAGVPAALELDALLLAVARQPRRKGFGKAFGHA